MAGHTPYHFKKLFPLWKNCFSVFEFKDTFTIGFWYAHDLFGCILQQYRTTTATTIEYTQSLIIQALKDYHLGFQKETNKKIKSGNFNDNHEFMNHAKQSMY